MANDRGPWVARDDEEFERRLAAEQASAGDLCTALRWHRANIAETLPVVDDDGDAERMAEVRQTLDALGDARTALARYYHLPPAAATADDLYARGEPPRLHARATGRAAAAATWPRGGEQESQRWALQQFMRLLVSDEQARPSRRPGVGLFARLARRATRRL